MVSRRFRERTAAAIALCVAVAAVSLAGAERIVLPAMDIGTIDGTPAESNTVFPANGKWLLAYVQPNCLPCDRLLKLLDKSDNPQLSSRLVVVVASGPAQAVATRGAYKNLGAAQWYTDRVNAVWSALKLSGVPVVYGVQDRTIHWNLSGVLKSDEQVKSMLESWVE